ncbi:DUF4956 domain-containing protein [Candidatus Pelagibacter sp.]|nr:DUF4956 domain-containing protein [Candidatus Pelagibacter sp.]
MSDATLGQLQNIYSPTEILVNIILSFFLGLFISYIYKITHKGMSYSQSFMITNIFIALIVCMVIMIIGNNIARAFALVGALSIIRFRTVVKDTKDIAYIFWSLASGMAAGTGSYYIAIIGTIIISVVAIILFKTNYGSIYKSEFLLQFRYNKDEKISTPIYNDVFKELCKSTTLLNSEISGDNKTLKLTFDIYLKEKSEVDDFTLKISKLEGISEVSVVASKSDVDY